MLFVYICHIKLRIMLCYMLCYYMFYYDQYLRIQFSLHSCGFGLRGNAMIAPVVGSSSFPLQYVL
jgi:hypothetical protein